MSPRPSIPYAENEGDALFVVLPLRQHHHSRQRLSLKTSQGLIYVLFPAPFPRAAYLDAVLSPKSVVGVLSSKTCCLSEQVVCASVLSTLLWNGLCSQRFVGRHPSITKEVLEETQLEILVEAALQGT
jgi:hypothetical protein